MLEIASCFTLIVFFLLRVCILMYVPICPMGWSMIRDCGIYWSYKCLSSLGKNSNVRRPYSWLYQNSLLAEQFLRVGFLRNIQNECVCDAGTFQNQLKYQEN